jgi:type I restriction enzyme S subunit
MPRTGWERLGEFRVNVPSLGAQHDIAAHLDSETARIDALIAKKQRLRWALRERYAAVVGELLGNHEGIKLKHLLSAPLAYGVLVPVHDLNGVPMLRITDLRTGVVDMRSVNRIPASLSAEFRRTVLELGDLVVSVVGTLGRSIEVSSDLVGCNLNRALARVQLKTNVPRALVRLWFESEDFQLQARLATSGDSAQPTLGLGDMKDFAIGIPKDPTRWSAIADRMIQCLDPIEKAVVKLDRQERLVLEHRQALITAAVTGELHIPGVA